MPSSLAGDLEGSAPARIIYYYLLARPHEYNLRLLDADLYEVALRLLQRARVGAGLRVSAELWRPGGPHGRNQAVLDTQHNRVQGMAAVAQLARNLRAAAAAAKDVLENARYATDNSTYLRAYDRAS